MKAQNLIRKGKITPGQASRQFKIPKTTLQRYKMNRSLGFTKKGFNFYLRKDEEASLKTYISWMGNHNCLLHMKFCKYMYSVMNC